MTLQNTYLVREMTDHEIDRINEIDMTESGDVWYRWIDGRMTSTRATWQRPPRSAEQWAGYATDIREVLVQGGKAWGAFCERDMLIGIAVLKNELLPDMAELTALWVSHDWRRCGVATQLLQRVIEAARTLAQSMYVTATPSVAAISFYQSIGFEPTAMVHRDRYDAEPEDIHMIMQL